LTIRRCRKVRNRSVARVVELALGHRRKFENIDQLAARRDAARGFAYELRCLLRPQ
jgi:hypothetical protein